MRGTDGKQKIQSCDLPERQAGCERKKEIYPSAI